MRLDTNGCHVCGHIDCPLPAAESARIATDTDACAKWLAALADCATRPPVDWRGGYFAAGARAERAEAERDAARDALRKMEQHADALAARLARLESHLAPMADRPSFCPECGPGVAVDADGCCNCGCDALGAAADDLAALVKRGVGR